MVNLSEIIDTIGLSRETTAPVIKGFLAGGEERLKKAHLSGATGTAVCKSYTGLIDEILRTLFRTKSVELAFSEPAALVAVGGYGRGELNLRSDIDLMLLHGKKTTAALEEFTQKMLYVLWDTGLDMGFSIRSIPECIDLASDDLKTMTALLDLRFITGDEALYSDLFARVRRDLFSRQKTAEFIEKKLDETRQRHAKYGGSVYILEPNLKEGEGGLRDFHTALWVLKAKNHKSFEPFSLGLISEADKASLEGSLDFLLWVRNELHFSTGRKTDQLSFDHQERIASLLGFENTEKSLAVEAFMQGYYRHASNINHYSNLMLSRSLNRDDEGGKNSFWPKKRVRIDRHYSIIDNVLVVRDKEPFFDSPSNAIKAFEYSQAFNAEISQSAKDLVLKSIEQAGPEFTSSKESAESFLKILKHPSVYKTLSEMHKLRFLESYIPEFREISCRTQHDLYHVYTVDAHTLFAVRELERLRGQYKVEFSLLATIFEELPNPEILILSVLLHDIGKAHGKGHAEKGARMVPEICRRLHLSEDDANLVRFLVKNHLILANTAQYRDLHDEKLIIEFAKQVGDIERLNLLYLLTFADVRAVGPDVWSQWKGALLQELYFKALIVLERGTFEPEEAEIKVSKIRERVTEILRPEGVSEGAVQDYFELLPHRYFLSNTPDSISEHIKVLRDFSGRPYLMTFRQDKFREFTEILVCTHDVHGLFSMITGVMAANAVNILGAQINTLRNGIVIDILHVNSATGELITDETKFKKIERDFSDVITGKVRISDLVGRRKPSILDKRARPKVKTFVEIDNDVSDSYTVLDIHAQNRIGLLYDITSAVSKLGLYIYIAKISTKGDEAADIFYIKDIFGQKIYFKEKLKDIVDTLYVVLEAPGQGEDGKRGS